MKKPKQSQKKLREERTNIGMDITWPLSEPLLNSFIK